MMDSVKTVDLVTACYINEFTSSDRIECLKVIFGHPSNPVGSDIG